MNRQVTPELLSAYLDRELPETEQRELESHLATSAETRERLDRLRRVVDDLHRLERTQAPPALEGRLARALALERDRVGLLARLERGMSVLGRQSITFLMFALVFAFGILLYLFSQAVERHERSQSQVIFTHPGALQVEGGERLEAAGRIFRRREGFWLEQGRPEDAAGRSIAGSSAEGLTLGVAHPELEELWRLEDVFVLEIGGELVRLDTRRGAAPGDTGKTR